MSYNHTQLTAMLGLRARPQVMGRRVAIASDHYLAAAAGLRIAMQGGNAIDCAAAVCLCQNVLKQNEASLGGECPVLLYSARDRKVYAISGVGWTPKALTVDVFRREGISLIPGIGFLPMLVPAVLGTWALALSRFGTMRLAQVLAPALELAEQGFPMHWELQQTIRANHALWEQWPGSRELLMPGGTVPEVGQVVRNPALAAVFRRLCEVEEANLSRGREAAIRAARDEFYRGEIARRIVDFAHRFAVEDGTGRSHTGLIEYEDLAEWEAEVEEPISLSFRGLEVHKCPTWTQGAVFLQQLSLLDGCELEAKGLGSAEYVHTVQEAAKLAFADREAYYGDPRHDTVPLDTLLSPAYAAERRRLIGDTASRELRPGRIEGYALDFDLADVAADNARALGLDATPGGAATASDTTHLDVADAEGNMVAATPSGAWLRSSPVVPELGFPLSIRGDVFYLNPARPNCLAPRKRPRVTLTPSLATRDGEPYLAFGMRGGDIQDQLTLQFLVNHAVFGLDVQDALDVPAFYSLSFPNSFNPRTMFPARVCIENRADPAAIAALRERGHDVVVLDQLRANHMAVRRDPATGVLSAGVCSNGASSYTLAW